MTNNTLKIAYFIDRLIRGGTELQLVEQIDRLAERGVQQELFCLYKSHEHKNINIKCRVHILGITKLMSLNCLRKFFFLRQYLKENSFSIVQTYFFDSTVVGVLAGKLAFRPMIFSCRRDLGFWYTPELLFFLRFINTLTDRILVNSNAVKESVMRKELADPEKICVIPNGIDIKSFQYTSEEKSKNREELGIGPQEICVGMIANMNRKVKRVDLFLETAKYVLDCNKNFYFMVLGDGKLKDDLIAMAQGLGIDNKISFLGRDISKHKILSSMDIAVLTSDSEGFSNAIMEYMAAGLPVIATAVGGNLELVVNEETGFLIAPGDYKQLGEKVILMGSDLRKRQEFGREGKKLIANYDWENMMDKIIGFYQEMVGL